MVMLLFVVRSSNGNLANVSNQEAYGGGTIHVIVNNQIEFTTSNSADSRSTRYATDISKFIETPIFHVNADDPRPVIQVSKLTVIMRTISKKMLSLIWSAIEEVGTMKQMIHHQHNQ